MSSSDKNDSTSDLNESTSEKNESISDNESTSSKKEVKGKKRLCELCLYQSDNEKQARLSKVTNGFKNSTVPFVFF